MEFRWQDTYGLEGKEPFTLSINGRADEAPSLTCEDLPRQKVVLDSEMLGFKIRAQDDFGIRRVGIEWQGVDNPVVSTPAKGERILAGGGHDKESLEVAGTFSAKSLGIEPQPIAAPDVRRGLSPRPRRGCIPAPYTFYVLTPEQHAIWLTEQLSRWHRQAIDVRDRELQLYETNKQLRSLRCRGAGQAREPPSHREPGFGRTPERAPALGPGRLGRGPGPPGDAEPRVRRRPPREVGRDAPDPQGHLRQPDADGLRPAQAGRPGADEDRGEARRRASRTVMAGQIRASGTGQPKEGDPRRRRTSPSSPASLTWNRRQNSPPDKPLEGKPGQSKGGSPPQRLPVTTLMGKPQDSKGPPPRDPRGGEAG